MPSGAGIIHPQCSDVLHLSGTNQLLDISAFYQQLITLAKPYDATVSSDNLTKSLVAHADLHIHLLWCLCISSEVQRLLAFWHILLHVFVEQGVVQIQIL